MGKMLRLRTRLLLCGAALAPAAIALVRMEAEDIRLRMGAESLWFDPGLIPQLMVYIGIICFLGFLISLFLDFRKLR